MKKFLIICFLIISAYIVLQPEAIVFIYNDYRIETNLFFPVSIVGLVAAFFWTLAQQKASWMLYWIRCSYRHQAREQQAQIAVYEFRQELASFLIRQGWQNLLEDALRANPVISARDLQAKQQQWWEAHTQGQYEVASCVLTDLGLSIPQSIHQKMFIEGFSRQFEDAPAYLVPDIFDGLRVELNKKPALKNIFLLRLNLLKKDQQKFLLKQIDVKSCSAQELSMIHDVLIESPQEWRQWIQNHDSSGPHETPHSRS